MICRMAFTIVILATTAWADCPPEQDVFSSCHIAGRGTEVSVCFDEGRATYSYGPAGGLPELVLSETIEHLEFEPWSGVTRSTGESVTFHNGEFSYTLVGGFERLLPSEDAVDESGDPDALTRHYGWIEVARNGEKLQRLECIPDTVAYAFGNGLYDLKIAAGLAWDEHSRRWKPALR